MAGAMRKMAVYLGLVEDDDEMYAEYDADPERYDSGEPQRSPAVRRYGADEAYDRAAVKTAARGYTAPAADPGSGTWSDPEQVREVARITTLHPRTYNEARTIGEHFRAGTPVIMNLTEMDDTDAKRLVDFSAGLIFGLHGTIERITSKVFLLSPQDVEVAAETKAQIAEGGFFNQS